MHRTSAHHLPLAGALVAALAALISACSSPPPAKAPPVAGTPPTATATVPAAPEPPPVAAATPQSAAPATPVPPTAEAKRAPPGPSQASTAQAYRQSAAGHVYAQNAERIYKGKLKPLLYAIGVLEVDIDRNGNVVSTRWRRAPSHAPEVMEEILRTVRAAAPYPAPARIGRVTWFDVWLWDKSGKFQLDTLTEGQL